jgi:hypothetical protein
MSEVKQRLQDHIDFLSDQGYVGTAKGITELIDKILTDQIATAEELSKKVIKLFDVFAVEYKNSCPIGRTYRFKCFREAHLIVLRAYANLSDPSPNSLPMEYLVFLEKMNKTDDQIASMARLLSQLINNQKRTQADSELMFSTACHIYLISLEGIFGELAKLVFGLLHIAEGTNVLSVEELNDDHVWKIYRKCETELGIKPVFLERWKLKSEIRNAIAHAQAQYNPNTDRAHFYSKNSHTGEIFEESMTFRQFFAIWLEVADAEDALRYSLRLMEIATILRILHFVKITANKNLAKK